VGISYHKSFSISKLLIQGFLKDSQQNHLSSLKLTKYLLMLPSISSLSLMINGSPISPKFNYSSFSLFIINAIVKYFWLSTLDLDDLSNKMLFYVIHFIISLSFADYYFENIISTGLVYSIGSVPWMKGTICWWLLVISTLAYTKASFQFISSIKLGYFSK